MERNVTVVGSESAKPEEREAKPAEAMRGNPPVGTGLSSLSDEYVNSAIAEMHEPV
ncbi:hypothetical protein T07_8405 [Trichinella nelsoni]|uniref:Uncharacterized protein n=1 Tax=Trichinella nelsoni TaxID=6336 RepID=A0A0V0RMI0_9BILA|nr:hypothetical protein T07_8405 [Trichinella nelsoni]